MRAAKRILLALVAIVVGFALVSGVVAWRVTDPLHQSVGPIPPELPSGTEAVSFASRDGLQLSGWFVPQEGTSRAVVLLHGHGSSRQQMVARARLFHEAGHAVLLYDARGHGESEGDRVSAGWFETADLLGALDYLRTKNLREFGCLGVSQGGATILLAAERLPIEVRWVIVESVYPDIRDALDRRFRMHAQVPGWLGGALVAPMAALRLGIDADVIAPSRHIGGLRCPVFVLGGADDQHTLATSTLSLFEAARAPKQLWMVPGAAHVDLQGFAKQDYAERVLAFVAGVQARATDAP